MCSILKYHGYINRAFTVKVTIFGIYLVIIKKKLSLKNPKIDFWAIWDPEKSLICLFFEITFCLPNHHLDAEI